MITAYALSGIATVEIGILIAIIAGLIGVATYSKSVKKTTIADGVRWGRWEEKQDRIEKDIEKIIDKLDKHNENAQKANDELAKRFDDSVRRVHQRIDDHLRSEHGIKITESPLGGL
jgi:alpha-D-ribose 1-methylphosphonate 5-triphosphate diphosphatase PhnM